MQRIEIEQGSPEWHELRRNKIGGSDAAAIMGCDPYKTARDVWEQKVLRKQQHVTNAMRRGNDLESVARHMFEKITGRFYPPAVIISDQYDWMMASLDGLSDEGIILEIKTVKPGGIEDEPRESWTWQIQHQLIVTEAAQAVLFVFDGTDYKIHMLVRDEEDCRMLLSKEKEFYVKWMLGFEAPPGPLPINDNFAMIQAVRGWKEAKSRLEQAKSDEEAAKQEVTDLASESCLCEGVKIEKRPGRKTVSWKMIPGVKEMDLTPFTKQGEPYWQLTESDS